MLTAPDALGSGLAFLTAPPEHFVPEPVRGHPVVGVVLCWAGAVDDGRCAPRCWTTTSTSPGSSSNQNIPPATD